MMQIRNAVLAESNPFPALGGLMYQFIVAGNGTFIRAEDSRLEACAPVAFARVYGLVDLEPYAKLKVPRIPSDYLWSIFESARRHLPNEAMYQFIYDPRATTPGRPWRCRMPEATASRGSVEFADGGDAAVDLHSHGTLAAFFSTTDDGDEQGLRFYVVIGKVDTAAPEIAVRVGVYGHHMTVPVTTLFTGPGPFVEVDPEVEIVLLGHEVDEDETAEPAL